MKNQKGISVLALIIIVVVVVVLLFMILGKNDNSSENKEISVSASSTSNDEIYKLGDTITFDGLEITFDSTYTFVTIQNQFSEYNGKSVIKLGATVKNISSEKNYLNMFYYSLFGSQGTELSRVTAYFDDTIDYAGELKPEASYKKYFYILYDGDGDYSIDFDNFSQEISVEFSIYK
jgi:hypothetical protein